MKTSVLTSLLVAAALGFPLLGAPHIAVDANIYDFGQIIAGLSVVHAFTLTNTGDQPLGIVGVSAGCGCTTTALAKSTLGPGESIPLQMTVNTAWFSGTIFKTVTVASTDPATPALDLIMTGIVFPAQDYQTATAELDRLYFLLIDLRTPEEYQTLHLMGAVNVPYVELDEWMSRLPHGVLVILCDRDGSLSDQAAQTLQRAGFPEARSLLGGLDRWMLSYQDRYLLPAGQTFSVSATISPTPAYPIDVAELDRIFLLLLDLRTPEEYAAGHLLGATSVPYEELAQWMANLPQGVPIVLYDQAGSLSDQAAQALQQAGFRRAQSLLGGLDEWMLAYGNKYLLATDAK